MYTYVQRPGSKKVNTTTYVHTGRVWNAYSRVRTARAHVHGWVEMEKLRRRRVHGEATKCVVFMGSQRNRRVHWEATERVGANRLGRNRETTSYSSGCNRLGRNTSCSSGANRLGWNSRWKRGLAYRRMEETTLCSTGHGRNGILFIGRGLAYRKTEETDLLRSKRGSC